MRISDSGTGSAAPRRLGLTGSIGAGKSTVARLLRERGLTVLDADAEARAVTEQPEVLAELEAAFPGVVVGGTLDRAGLAARVFGDPAQVARLNAITHPRVRARMQALEAQAAAGGAKWVVQDIPLLFEGGLERGMDAVLVVDAPLELRLTRALARGSLTREDILARDARQMSAEEKRKRATAVLDNSGSLADLTAQLGAALLALGIT